MTDTRDAKMGVKVGEAIWDFIRLRQNRPLPRSRFCMRACSRQNSLHKSGPAGDAPLYGTGAVFIGAGWLLLMENSCTSGKLSC